MFLFCLRFCSNRKVEKKNENQEINWTSFTDKMNKWKNKERGEKKQTAEKQQQQQ